jgi:two-component system sensor histidine kinase YesM
MMQTINDLMIETRQAVEKQKEAEVRALEAQINPHFLYNTLDAINWLAIEKEEYQISKMLKGLAQILRYSIKDSNKTVFVADEMKWMQQYVFLQQHRFHSSFQCSFDVSPETLNYRIHKLILQPFIENAIIHGFNGRKKDGMLVIHIGKKDERAFEIVIDDNGMGMEQETVDALLRPGRDQPYARGSGLGIRNALARLDMYYGNLANAEIQSTEGRGTRIKLTLPILYT